MLPRNLEYLVALAEERHFGRAARRCGVSQPTLSAGLKQLEEELGVLLVERGQRFERFTLEGERVLRWARRILADVSGLEQEVRELREGLTGRLRLGVIPTALPILPTLVTPFLKTHPRVQVEVVTGTASDIQRGLDDFTLDAGVTYLGAPGLAGVSGVPLLEERYYVFGPATVIAGGVMRWADAAELPLCLLIPSMQQRQVIDQAFAQAGVMVRPQVEADTVFALLAHARSGPWCTVLPHTFIPLFEGIRGVAHAPLAEPTVVQPVGVVVPDREPLTPSARALSAMARDVGGAVG